MREGKGRNGVSEGRWREREEEDNEEMAVICLPVFDQWSVGSRGGADSWSTAPEERGFTFLLALSLASAKSRLVFQTTAAVKTHRGSDARTAQANALWCHCPAGPHPRVQFLSEQTHSYPEFFSYSFFFLD